MPKHDAIKRLPPSDVAHLVALAMACPVHQDNPADCPLHAIRQLPVKERFQWAKSRTREEANAIFDQHATCLRQNLAHQPPR